MPKLVILREEPSSGKSTICEEILKKDSNIVWLHVDSFKKFLRTGDVDGDRDHLYGAAAVSLSYYLKKGFSVISECIFQYHKHVDLFVNVAKEHNVETVVFDLVVPYGELSKRDKKRKGVPGGLRKALSEETIKELSSLVNDNPYPGAIQIKTQEVGVLDVVE